ncbi:MAG: hypothetical protein Kow0022_03370 [Phycisphaerales bacterium]
MGAMKWVVGVVAGCVVIGSAGADGVTLFAAKDNTLYESSTGSLSNGAGSSFFSGVTAGGEIRRGLIEFDIAAAVPAGSTINSAMLVLNMSRTVSGPQPLSLHAATREWGEGTSNASGQEGSGAVASDGDATWVHAVFDSAGGSILWTNPGGDFVATASATVSVGGVGSYTWSGPGVVSDVQGWLDDPSGNHGWVIVGEEESLATSKRFDSRENINAANRPRLVIDFTPPAVCAPDLNNDGVLNFFDVQAFLQAFSVQDPVADFNNDSQFDFFDVQAFLQAFSAGCP